MAFEILPVLNGSLFSPSSAIRCGTLKKHIPLKNFVLDSKSPKKDFLQMAEIFLEENPKFVKICFIQVLNLDRSQTFKAEIRNFEK